MSKAWEALGIAEGTDTHTHGSRRLRPRKKKKKEKKISTEPIIDDHRDQEKQEKPSRIERVTLSVSGSLMRRTSREFRRTILLYSRVSVRGFTISAAASPILGKNLKDYYLLLSICMQFFSREERVRSLYPVETSWRKKPSLWGELYRFNESKGDCRSPTA